MKKSFVFLASAAAALATANPATAAKATLTAETTNPGGAPYIAVTSLGELASREGIADFQVSDGQTLTNSLQNVAEGKTDLAPVPFILPFLLSKGAGPYAKLGKEKGAELAKNVRVLYTYRFGGMGLYAYNSAGIKGWDKASLQGKKIINGPPRGGALANGRALIRIATGLEDGKGYTGVQSNWGQMAKTITSGGGDAMVLPIYFPDDRITRGLAAGDITLWSVPKAVWEKPGMQKYLKSPGSAPFVIDLKDVKPQKGLTIVSEDGTWRSPATVGGDIVNKDMDFELARKLTAAMIEGLDVAMGKAPLMRFSALGSVDRKITGLCGPVPVKYHPGAVAAWEEAGHKIPDCAK